MFQVTVLGCGGSVGVPMIGCSCKVCKSNSLYNKRTRSAIFISDENSNILVDFGFDIKDQIVQAEINKLDGAILTHDHADHVAGIDNLRLFTRIQQRPLNIYTDYTTAAAVEHRYQYLFTNKQLIMNSIGFFDKLNIGNLSLQLFRQHHGSIDSIGIRIKNFVYSSDIVDFPVESKQYLYNIEIWVLDCTGDQSSKTHAGLDKILQWNEEYQPQQIFLTNMQHTIDYHEISTRLPKNIRPLYDGYKFIVN
ncbi:MBL fold metallo-hydrolase [Candidatus Trichorickettsia mobilis]|uniref:MBL fold metallo-hydrolase n=1 Tax=Candidatus Trichorickettsia mobilis TaxID=1346319 RepID=A0ABZ0USR3_9RICK|nr:MBL fold metallo-hydrolase [Candidatus Trichorickettsia mobilis]WPY01067.1 MBL fold metallo-hydrolase [Candidatus Trichorickettsia mobilis]